MGYTIKKQDFLNKSLNIIKNHYNNIANKIGAGLIADNEVGNLIGIEEVSTNLDNKKLVAYVIFDPVLLLRYSVEYDSETNDFYVNVFRFYDTFRIPIPSPIKKDENKTIKTKREPGLDEKMEKAVFKLVDALESLEPKDYPYAINEMANSVKYLKDKIKKEESKNIKSHDGSNEEVDFSKIYNNMSKVFYGLEKFLNGSNSIKK